MVLLIIKAKGMLNQFQEVEELLTMIQSEKIRNDFTYIQWLARACEHIVFFVNAMLKAKKSRIN